MFRKWREETRRTRLKRNLERVGGEWRTIAEHRRSWRRLTEIVVIKMRTEPTNKTTKVTMVILTTTTGMPLREQQIKQARTQMSTFAAPLFCLHTFAIVHSFIRVPYYRQWCISVSAGMIRYFAIRYVSRFRGHDTILIAVQTIHIPHVCSHVESNDNADCMRALSRNYML